MSKYRKLLKDKKLMSGIYAVSLITALLILALAVRGPEKSGTLIADSSGNITGINRHSLKRTERYDLGLEVGDGEEPLKREVTITLQAVSGGGEKTKSDRTDNEEAKLDAEIDSMISTIEYSKKKKISLPLKLSDGTSVRWSGSKPPAGPEVVIIPIMYLTLVAMMIVNAAKGDNTAAEERRSIMRGLPRFCNQLYLMMNAGLILSDAFDTISCGYENNATCSTFEKDLAGLREATEGHRISTAQVLNEYAVKHDVKELSGIGKLLPITMACFMAASLSLVGIPPMGGFLAKWNLGLAVLSSQEGIWAYLPVVVLLISAMLTAGYLFPVVIGGFVPVKGREVRKHDEMPQSGSEEKAGGKIREPLLFVLPMILLCMIALLVGLFGSRVLPYFVF